MITRDQTKQPSSGNTNPWTTDCIPETDGKSTSKLQMQHRGSKISWIVMDNVYISIMVTKTRNPSIGTHPDRSRTEKSKKGILMYNKYTNKSCFQYFFQLQCFHILNELQCCRNCLKNRWYRMILLLKHEKKVILSYSKNNQNSAQLSLN